MFRGSSASANKAWGQGGLYRAKLVSQSQRDPICLPWQSHSHSVESSFHLYTFIHKISINAALVAPLSPPLPVVGHFMSHTAAQKQNAIQKYWNKQSHKMRNWLLHTMSQRAEPSLPAAGNLSPTCLRPFGNFFLFPRCWHRFRSFSRSELYWWWWSLFFFGRNDSPLVSASRFFLARGFCRFSTRSWGFRATSFCRGRRKTQLSNYSSGLVPGDQSTLRARLQSPEKEKTTLHWCPFNQKRQMLNEIGRMKRVHGRRHILLETSYSQLQFSKASRVSREQTFRRQHLFIMLKLTICFDLNNAWFFSIYSYYFLYLRSQGTSWPKSN